MRTINYLLLSFLSSILFVNNVSAQSLQASFSADEASVAYYEQGWDSQNDFSQWTYASTTGNVTWKLSEFPQFYGTTNPAAFSSIEPSSKYSLAIDYSSSAKDETAISPEIDIVENSSVEYYLCLYAVWFFNADLKFFVINTETGEKEQLVSTFMWAQDNGFTGPNWIKFSFDLAKYADKKCQFCFQYAGTEGENVYIDGFRVKQKNDSEDAVISIFEGEQVHFKDQSLGNPTSWQWQFEGADTATSGEKDPIVVYNNAGTYSVTLTVANADGISSAIRNNYINVVAQAPTALIGVPAEGYLSPWVYSFVPTNTPIQFLDQSLGKPTSWLWTLEGATPATSTEQNPVVVYENEGVYGLTLDVENAAGLSNDFLKNAIQAGGTQDIWNIAPEETASMGKVSLGFYGNYAGTNWLGINLFAERFHRPVAEAAIDKVSVFFETTATVTPDAPITVSICTVGSGDNPSEVLASATLRADQLVYDSNEVIATEFVFDSPVTVSDDFFVVIGPFPNNDTDQGSDDISMLCVRRQEGQPTTTWHQLEDEDSKGNRLGTYTWYKNIDSPVSMAVAPSLTYKNVPDNVADYLQPSVSASIEYYNIMGQRISESSLLRRGIVITRQGKLSVKKVFNK